MYSPELVFVTGPNAAGKSSFIRSRLGQLENFEILMTDVFKGRVFELFDKALHSSKNIILETIFNDSKFKDLVEKAKGAGYYTRLVQLFVDTPTESLERANYRRIFENGLAISKNTILINFNENFKNVAQYYFYFDRVDLIYNGGKNEAINLATFEGLDLTRYQSNESNFIKRFAEYAFHKERMDKKAFDIISANQDFSNEQNRHQKDQQEQGRRFKI